MRILKTTSAISCVWARLPALSLAALLTVLGCSGGNGAASGDGDGDGLETGGTGGTDDISGTGGGGPTVGTGGSSNRHEGLKFANLTFSHTVNEFTIPFQGTATVIESIVVTPDAKPCTVTEANHCELKVCSFDSETTPNIISRTHAGQLTLTSPDLEGSVVLAPDEESSYDQVSSDLARAGGGETMVLTASGGEVPGFTQQFTFPLALILETPADAESRHVSVAQGAPVTLTWQDRGEDSELYIYGVGVWDDRVSQLTCNIPSSLETITLDASVMSEFPPATKIRLHVAQRNHFMHEGYDFSVYFVGPVTNPAKDGYVCGIEID